MDEQITGKPESESQPPPQTTGTAQGDKIAIEQRVDIEPPRPGPEEPMDTPAPKRSEAEAPDQDALL